MQKRGESLAVVVVEKTTPSPFYEILLANITPLVKWAPLLSEIDSANRSFIHKFLLLLSLSSLLIFRSCDLDSWNRDQLNIMTVSGNANAALFFKKHGFTDLHTQSDKKYKSN